MDWNEVWKGKRIERKKKSMSRLLLLKQSEMILPSVLSEASSLEAERERERGGGRNKMDKTKGNKEERIDTND